MALTLSKTGSAPEIQAYELHPGVTTFGRAEGNTYVINDGSVSGSHCQVTVDGETVIFQDLGSTNGSQIDGASVTTDAVYIIPGVTKVLLGKVQVNLVLPNHRQVAVPVAVA
ncbi:MAG: mucD 1, partial [Verrucomicrobiales bacterium]|nr:mucD 1 [Verrucomicrobiales bacterium]